MRVLFLAQAIGQGYVDLITQALPADTHIALYTGSDIKGSQYVTVVKSPEYRSVSISSRLKTWLKYCYFVLKNSRDDGHYSLIYAVSNPPLNSFLGWYLKRKYQCPFVFMNWDLYPQVVEAKFTSRTIRFICDIWHRLNNRIFPKIDCIITLAEGMKNTIQSKVKSHLNIEIIPIHTDVQTLKPVAKENNIFLKQHNLQDKFIVLFSGKMGLGHNLQIIVDAAEKLIEQKDICFIMIGDGEQFSKISQQVRDKKLTNMLVLPRQSYDIFPYSMASGDVDIVSVDATFAGLSMPSRTYDMMATGTPIIGICREDDNLGLLIRGSGIGRVVTNNDVNEFVKTVLELKNNEVLRQQMGQAARKIAVEEYAFPVVLEKYKKIFDSYVA